MSKIRPEGLQYEENTRKVGTPFYNSLQVLRSEGYTNKCDIWALGVTLYFMLYGEVPWKIMAGLTKFNLDKIVEQVITEGLLFADEIDPNKKKLFDLNPKVLPLL